MLIRRTPRRGALVVESAIVLPILFFLLLVIVVIGLTVFRYQQCAHAAREGARWASVHGAQYAKESGKPAATAEDVFNNAIQPQIGGMAPNSVTYTVTWPNGNSVTRSVTVVDPVTRLTKVVPRANTVEVTVTYHWGVGVFKDRTVSAKSVNLMSY